VVNQDSQQLQKLLGEIIRVGLVSSVDTKAASARVTFPDRRDLVSYDLPVLVRNTKKNKDYWLPDINEQVVCLFLPTGTEQGYILGGFYSKKTMPDVDSQDKRRTYYEDGSSVEYDRASHTLTIDVPADGGTVIVNAHTSVTVNSPKINLGEAGALEPSVLGDKLAEYILGELKPWLDGHNHPSGTPFTGPAQSGSVGAFPPGNGNKGGNVYSVKNKNQ
jgi:phage baseplate assembly protein V